MINGTLLEDLFIGILMNIYKYDKVTFTNTKVHFGLKFPIYAMAMLNSHLYPKYNLCIFSIGIPIYYNSSIFSSVEVMIVTGRQFSDHNLAFN